MKNLLVIASLSVFSPTAFALAQEKPDSAEFVPYDSCTQEILRKKPELREIAAAASEKEYTLGKARDSSDKLDVMCTSSATYGSVGIESLTPLLASLPQTTAPYLNMTEQEREQLKKELTVCTLRTEELHKEALEAAEAAYERKAPPGFHIVHTFSDAASGFKALLLEPDKTPPGEKPQRILSIAGTENLKDVHSDLAFGRSQYKANVRRVLAWVTEFIRDTGDVIFTGHSLGGGLAQAFAYATEEQLKKLDITGTNTKGKIHIATWNAFGGKELITVSGSRDSPGKPRFHMDEFMPHVAEAVNYRMQGDPVSLLGTHIGEVRTIPAPQEAIERVSLQNAEELSGGGAGASTQEEIRVAGLRAHRLRYLSEAADRGELKFAVPTTHERRGLSGVASKAITRAATVDALGHWLGEQTLNLASSKLRRISSIK